MTKTDYKWMKAAIDQALKCTEDVPVGSIVVLEDKIIGRGHNQREEEGDPTAHAEMIAIREAAKVVGGWRLTGAEIFSTLEPCPMCAEAMIQARVARVVYGAFDTVSGAAGSMVNLFLPGRIYPIPEVFGGIDEESCSKLLVDFFKGRRNSAT